METQNTEERFPVNPNDFDQKSMLDTIKRMNDEENSLSAFGNMGELAGVSEREDDKFVYYDIPLKGRDGNNHKLNVEIKNGMIKISEDVKSSGDTTMETSSERMFSIDPTLNADKAEVMNEKEKIVIKIPKK
ncbi:MAG: hypothetical protein K2Q18_00515 [Bdellovibrionales bacterium]|nr:hypothetical protein [Bdellovibrionales bacterium]